jgi:ABC-type multidrug transport system ATPase subunit
VSGILSVRHVGFTRHGTRILDDVSFDVASDELLVLSGRSGSGKSTLLHLMAGISAPTSGSIVAGPALDAESGWAAIALAPQHSAVSPGLSVRENVELPGALHGITPRADLIAALDLESIADRPAADTSLGEQQRTAIGRALALGPTLALLDEPTSHQDDDNVDRVLSVLADARARGTAVVVATHDERVRAIADRVLALVGGRLADPAPT